MNRSASSPSKRLDVSKTVKMWTINIIAVVVVALLWVSLASAQPELKVGQEVRVLYSDEEGRAEGLTECWADVVYVDSKELHLRPKPSYLFPFGVGPAKCLEESTQYESGILPIPRKRVIGFHILHHAKPAPRPEFELPSNSPCPEEQITPCWKIVDPDKDAIADELRYLRKEIEGLKK